MSNLIYTIKRSDTIIVLSSDGTVAQQGSYADLSQDPASAFSKLMEWQMSGGETKGGASDDGKGAGKGAKESMGGYKDVVEGLAEEMAEGEEDEEALKEKKGGDEAGPQTVADKSQKR